MYFFVVGICPIVFSTKAVIRALQIKHCFIKGPSAPILQEKFGARAIVMVSGMIVGTSFIISSFVSSLAVITVILALFAGEYTTNLRKAKENFTKNTKKSRKCHLTNI